MKTMRDEWAACGPIERASTRVRGQRQEVEPPARMANLELLSGNPGPNPRAVAPCCGRPRPLDALVDLRPLGPVRETWLRQAGVRNPRAEIACRACIERLRRQGVTSLSVIATALGGTPAEIERFRRVENRRVARRGRRR